MLMRYLNLLLCVILHGVHCANSNDLTFREKAERYMKLNKECKRIEAWEYDYSQFVNVRQIEASRTEGYIIKLTTYVLGQKDVHILLSTTDTPDLANDEVYEFVIGAWDNTRTAIRKKTQNYPDLSNEETHGILTSEVPLKVVITITNSGEIKLLMEDPFKSIILVAYDPVPIAVNFVSFATSDDSTVEYFYNCPTDEKQLISTKTKELTAKCKYVVTLEDTYNNFVRIGDLNAIQPDGMLRFPLIIRGASDAHILLAAKKYFEWEVAYEIVIGGFGNTRAYIRTGDDDVNLVDVHYDNILPLDKPLIVVIEVSKAGSVRVFSKENFDDNFKLLMIATLKVPLPINYISFHASESSQNEFYYGCPYPIRRTDLIVPDKTDIAEDSTYAKTQVYAECTKIGVFDGEYIQYHKISDIRGTQPDGYLARIPVFVEANKDVTILLTTSSRPDMENDKLYQIVIGGWSNSRSVIRIKNSQQEEDVIASVLESDILAHERLIKLFVEISIAGDIKVFIQNNSQKPRPLLAGFDPNPLPIRYVAFTTIGNSTNEYYFKCNL